MGRGVHYRKTPEQVAQDAIRFADTLQGEEGRRMKVAGRLNHRDALLRAGADERFLPAVSQLTGSAPLDDSSYNDMVNRAIRFSNANARRNPVIMGDTVPGEGPRTNTPGEATVLPGKGGEANVKLESTASPGANLNPPGAGTYFKPEKYAGFPAGQKAIAKAALTKAWQQDRQFNEVANPAIVRDQDAMRIAAQYAGKGNIPENGQVGYYDKDGNYLGPLYHPQTGAKLPMPKGATGIRGTAGTSAPDTAQGQAERNATTPRTAFSPADANALGFSGEPSAIAAKPPAQRTPYEASYLMGFQGNRESVGVETPQPTTGEQVGAAIRTGANYVFGGGSGPVDTPVVNTPTGADVPAGVSRGQAARVQTPTVANPVPVTETSPATNINKTDQSTAPVPAAQPQAATQPLPDEWANKRYQFAGF